MISADDLKKLREEHEGCVIVLDDGAKCHAHGEDAKAVRAAFAYQPTAGSQFVARAERNSYMGPGEKQATEAAAPYESLEGGPEGECVTFARDALAAVITGLNAAGLKVVQRGAAPEPKPAP